MNPVSVLYDREGRPICDPCHNRQDLIETDRRAANNIRKAGFATLAAGVLGLIAPIAHGGLLLACAIAGLASGVFTLQSLARGNERFSNLLSPVQRKLALVCALLGILLLALSMMGANFGRLVGPQAVFHEDRSIRF